MTLFRVSLINWVTRVQLRRFCFSDGRLVEGDQILAIDGQPLDSNISHEQAISILQKARGLVELVVARSAQGNYDLAARGIRLPSRGEIRFGPSSHVRFVKEMTLRAMKKFRDFRDLERDMIQFVT